MRMRKFLTLSALAATLIAAPAFAQGRGPAPRDHGRDLARGMDLDRAGAMLSNPMVQDGAAAIIAEFADALLQTRVGPLAALTDPRDDVRPGDTLGDLARRDDPYFDRRLRDNSKRAVGAAGAALGAAGQMNRELEATAARLRAVMSKLDRAY